MDLYTKPPSEVSPPARGWSRLVRRGQCPPRTCACCAGVFIPAFLNLFLPVINSILRMRRRGSAERGNRGTFVDPNPLEPRCQGILVTSISSRRLLRLWLLPPPKTFSRRFLAVCEFVYHHLCGPNEPLPSPEAARSEGGVSYCVGLCDGRYFQFNVIAGQARHRHAARSVRQAQPTSTTATASLERSRQTASATRSLPPPLHTERRLSLAAPAMAGTPSASSTQPLLMIQPCVPATSSERMLV